MDNSRQPNTEVFLPIASYTRDKNGLSNLKEALATKTHPSKKLGR